MTDQSMNNTGEKRPDRRNYENTDNPGDILCNIEAENAALKVRIQQEYDRACAIVRDINKTDQDVEFSKRDIQRLNELIETKEHEVDKLEDETAHIALSREHIQKNSENLKKQLELLQIDAKQRQGERDQVRTNYETMIKYQKEIYNSYPLVMEKNNLENTCLASTVQLRILQQRIQNLDRQKKQMREIQGLKLRKAVLEFSEAFINTKKCYERKTVLIRQIGEKTGVLEELRKKGVADISAEESVEPTNQTEISKTKYGSPSVASLLTPVKYALNIPDITAVEHNSDLLCYLQQISSLKKNRSLGVLPPLLSRSYSPKSGHPCSKRRENTPDEKREISSPSSNPPNKRSRVESTVDKRSDDAAVAIDVDNIVNSSNHTAKTGNESALKMCVDQSSLDGANSKETGTIAVTSQMRGVDLNHANISSPRSVLLSPISKIPSCLMDGKHSLKSKIPVSKARKCLANNVPFSPSVYSPSKSDVHPFTSTPKCDYLAHSEDQAMKIRRTLIKENLPQVNKQMDFKSAKVGIKSSKGALFSSRSVSKVKNMKNVFPKEVQGSKPDHHKQKVSQVVRYIDEENSNSPLTKHNVHRKAHQGVDTGNEHENFDNMNSMKPSEREYLNVVQLQDKGQKPAATLEVPKQKNVSAKRENQRRSNPPSSFGKANELPAVRRISVQERNRRDLISREIADVTMEDLIEMINRGQRPELFRKINQEKQMPVPNVSAEGKDEIHGNSGVHIIENDGDFIPVREGDQMEEDELQENEDKYSKYFVNEKQVLEKSDRNMNLAQQPYDENYESNNEGMYASPTEDAPSNRNLTPSENSYPGRFSPSSDRYSFTTQGADNRDMINPFMSSSDGAAFGFGNSVNQIFGSNDQSTPDNAEQNKEPFAFNFAEPSNSSGGFQLFF